MRAGKSASSKLWARTRALNRPTPKNIASAPFSTAALAQFHSPAGARTSGFLNCFIGRTDGTPRARHTLGNLQRRISKEPRIQGCPQPLRPFDGLMADKFEEIFKMQSDLNKRIGVITEGMTEEEKIKWTLNYLRAMQQEMAELTDSVPWKWWAKYQKFDEQNARVEVIDLFHFLISIAQVLGMSAEDVYQAYLKKNAVNHQRQDSGYVKKDENDSRHI